MSPAAIRLALVVLLCALSAWGGWEWRDRSADVTTANRDAADAKAETAVVVDTREADKASQAGTAAVEQQHVQQQAQTATEFKYITREVIRYVASNPSPDGCGLDAVGLRIWQSASEGRASPEPEPAPVGTGAVP